MAIRVPRPDPRRAARRRAAQHALRQRWRAASTASPTPPASRAWLQAVAGDLPGTGAVDRRRPPSPPFARCAARCATPSQAGDRRAPPCRRGRGARSTTPPPPARARRSSRPTGRGACATTPTTPRDRARRDRARDDRARQRPAGPRSARLRRARLRARLPQGPPAPRLVLDRLRQPRAPGPPLRAAPPLESSRNVRPFQVGVDQAQEGGRRLAPRQALHEARPRDHHRGA